MLSCDLSRFFHPAVANWFSGHFAEPTCAQAEVWPAIKAGRHTLIAAPTGSGKTLAAFLTAIDDLVREGVACNLTEPSPLALEVLSARPYAFLDDAPLEERRTQAVMARRWHDPQSASELSRLDPEAIVRVRAEAWPDPANAEELHDSLLWLSCLTEEEAEAIPGWSKWLDALSRDNRVARLKMPGMVLWIPAERLNQFRAVWPEAKLRPEIAPPLGHQAEWSSDQALVEILRGRLEGLGPVTQTALAAPLGLEPKAVATALTALESEGTILRGRFLPGVNDEQWCDRRLLARIHHTTIRRLRSEIEPVAARDFLRFLFAWQHVGEETRLRGPDALPPVLKLLEGFEAPAGAWETEILPARVECYEPARLDAQCIAGRTTWARLTRPATGNGRRRAVTPVRSTPIALLDRRQLPLWISLSLSADRHDSPKSPCAIGARLSVYAGRIVFRRIGAGFSSAAPAAGRGSG